jgi:putative pyruvate formate lyase activating enzyme
MRISAAELRERARRLTRRLSACDLCPRTCGVNRLEGVVGFCGVGRCARLAAAVAHFGEEPPLSGEHGSGTLFFGGCNLRCSYCQNHQISRLELTVPEKEPAEIARAMLHLQAAGCHNIALVTPSHVVPQILMALAAAAERGLDLPIVYNTSAYDSLTTLAALDGVVDVYLPDLKYAGREAGASLSAAPDYWQVARQALGEMIRQCGPLALNASGVATRGVIVRHLVLPQDLAGTERVLAYVASLSVQPPMSLMAQFYPVPGCTHPALQRPLREAEYAAVRRRLASLGIDEGWIQDLSAEASYRPDFSQSDPFRQRPKGAV